MIISNQRRTELLERIRSHGGIIRMSEALRLGINRLSLYALRDAGDIVQIDRGLYRLADLLPGAHYDLVLVARRLPKGVICLISALAFHEITTEIPHEVYVALPPGAWTPGFAYPPVRTFRFSGESYTAGAEEHQLGGDVVRIYSPAKTVADCFKFRNKIGLDVAVEALRFALERRKARPSEILGFARMLRVERVITPYIQAIT